MQNDKSATGVLCIGFIWALSVSVEYVELIIFRLIDEYVPLFPTLCSMFRYK
jgi:hypothetical protein